MINQRQFVESLARGFKLLNIICESKAPLKLSELAQKSDLSLSTIQRMAYTLEQIGILARDQTTKKYHVGPQMISMALSIRQNMVLKRLAFPYLEEASHAVNEVVGLFIFSGSQIVLAEVIHTNQILNINMNTGAIVPLHATSTGKTILAFLPESELSDLLREYRFTRFTPHTITSVVSLYAQLEQVRNQGFAIAVDENALGVSSISAPIKNINGDVIATVTVMLPSQKTSPEKLVSGFAQIAVQTADKISFAMEYGKADDQQII